jgi:ribosomal protein S18 acetylase RimI-like enzyme
LGEIIYRKAKVSDLDEIIVLWKKERAFHRKFFPWFCKMKKNSESIVRREYKKIIKSNKDLFMVAEYNEKLVGFIITLIKNKPYKVFIWKKEAEIEELFVDEKVRGKKVGKTLMEKAITFAKMKNAEILRLEVSAKNESAKKFYESLGLNDFHIVMNKRLV